MNRVTIPDLRKMKQQGQRIVVLTAYDYTFSRLLDQNDIDLLLVGDSLGMVIQGQENTLPVTLDEMIYHCRAVARGSQRALIVADLPFGTFQAGAVQALSSAIRLMKEGGAHAVKLEGGIPMAETVRFLVERGIPVVGHIGLTPQSVHALGGFRLQGREPKQRERLLADASALEESGIAALVLEGMPASLAKEISHNLSVPTIGIGAGPDCDGQVLVLYDLLGLNADFKPRFVKQYLDGAKAVSAAVDTFIREVRDGTFPAAEQTIE